jgi:hypothetical protein
VRSFRVHLLARPDHHDSRTLIFNIVKKLKRLRRTITVQGGLLTQIHTDGKPEHSWVGAGSSPFAQWRQRSFGEKTAQNLKN